ncbi:Inositol 2-dehydrogenase [Aquisphaera giovannonii]|uniref:Inositol 2-dehydrogenase n=1 Tax=Aquisphaera giovannonii TaxID=406548 RepID=A0A5B9W736_9BACT|nr:Gfo/Idh/MocA family oxidoreductase [Aquisphaera giovannonii]QEH35905.1 Inositol 2-dehydrogenase [Aquisphaera giovannonii]
MKSRASRRDFSRVALGTAAASIAAPAASGRVLGANDRVTIGCIGVGNRGVQVLEAFCAQKDARVVALADVYEPYLHGKYDRIDARFRDLGKRVPSRQPDFGGEVERVKDFRRLLDRKDIDAVIVATPDHWHAIQVIMACEAGKDVYAEKPLSATVREGRRMVEAARKHDRVVQVGLQRRSSTLYARLAELVQSGAIGKVTGARACYASNMAPNGVGLSADSEPPAGLDWDLWLGPRPSRPFNDRIMPYKFRWQILYSSQMANWGVHYFDAMRWMVGERAPASLSAHGGKFALKDGRTIPDTAEVIFEMPSGMLMTFGTYEANGHDGLKAGEIVLRGTLATVFAGMDRFEIVPERGGAFQDPSPRRKPQVEKTGDRADDLDKAHARNFLDCVKSRQKPHCDVEEGHRSTTFALLANIALATRARLDWDADAERFTNHDEANQLLDYDYRPPWTHA